MNTQGGGGSREDPLRVPGVAETDYHWNSQAFYDFIASRGHRVVRIDFLWERVQPVLAADLDAQGIGELVSAVERARQAGLSVILDMKNYGRYWMPDDTSLLLGQGISVEQFQDVWHRLANVFAADSSVVGLGLMNEPWGLPVVTGGPSVWKTYSQAAVEAVRSAGYERSILVAGDEWSGVYNWSGINGAPWIRDPEDDILYEAHIYFDSDTSGEYDQSYDDVESDAKSRGYQGLVARMDAEVGNFTSWLQDHGVHGFIGEIGWPSDRDADKWNALGDYVYDLLNAAQLGATYWATGEWLATGNGLYPLDAYAGASLQPRAQATVIEDPVHQSK